MKNPFGKTVKQDAPYAVYRGIPGGPMDGWVYRVLKTYKHPDSERKDQYARWFLATLSPFTYGSYQLGDGYCHEILREVGPLIELVDATDEWVEHYANR